MVRIWVASLHQKTSTYESTLRFLFCYKARLTGRVDSNNSGADRRLRRKQGGEAGAALRFFKALPRGLQKKRQAQLVRPAEWSGGQKSPCGAFLDARLAISTRAHQKDQRRKYAGFLFYPVSQVSLSRVDSNSCGDVAEDGAKTAQCNSDDRCQRQKQGGAVGAAASRMRVPPKARHSRWEPRPGFLFILRGSRRPPCQTLFHRLLLKNAQTKTTVRVDGGSVIA